MENENNSSESFLIENAPNGLHSVHGSMCIDGNLNVGGQIKTSDINLINPTTGISAIKAIPSSISFNSTCHFNNPVEFNNGQTIIGIEKTYNSAYIGSPTIQVGDRLVFADSSFKVDTDTRTITADTYEMALKRLVNVIIEANKISSNEINSKNVQVSNELIANNFYANKITGKTFAFDNIVGINFKTSESLTTKQLFVNGFAKILNDLTIQGTGSTNGAALTVNGGEIVANNGIVSHTGNNRFQTMEIFGSGTPNQIGFAIDKYVDSLIQGNVTIQDSNLILDNSKLVSDEIIVAPIEVNTDIVQGIQVTTKGNWNEYVDGMKEEIPTEKSFDQTYNPYASVENAITRNKDNYESINAKVKTLLNPITYLMETKCECMPRKFNIKKGLYRIDSNGNALMKNVIAENGTFSTLSAHDFNVNVLNADKLVNTSVASNVIDSDQLLKSRGIAEFDGVVNTSADIFIEKDSNVNVAEGSNVTFQSGSSLKMNDGASLEIGQTASIKMHGDIEMDLSKLIFVDPSTGNKYKISFKDSKTCEGTTITSMEYTKVIEQTPREIVDMTSRKVSELDMKLKSLGI